MNVIKKNNEQINLWKGEFGKEYTDRNLQTLEEMEEMYKAKFGYTRTEINEEIIGNMDRKMRILEVGCNIGNQLLCLQQMGFTSLYGIEPQEFALERAKARTKNIPLKNSSAFGIPYKDGFFDLIFTSGVLIHISPIYIKKALKEIYRCTKKYIWGYEYFAIDYLEVEYRGKKELMWKTDFAKLYLDTFNDLKLIKEKRYNYLSNNDVDTMFILKKA